MSQPIPAERRTSAAPWSAVFRHTGTAQEGRFQEESEHGFHRQGLSDNPAGKTRETRPVGAELEFHWDSSHHANDKVNGKNLCPEAGGLIIAFVVSLKRQGLQDNNQWPHFPGSL